MDSPLRTSTRKAENGNGCRLRSAPGKGLIPLKFARVCAYACRVSAFRPFSTCGTDAFSSSFFFARHRPDTGPRRDWTTKRLASLSTKRVAEETSALSPPLGGEPSDRLAADRCIGELGKKKKKNGGNPACSD